MNLPAASSGVSWWIDFNSSPQAAGNTTPRDSTVLTDHERGATGGDSPLTGKKNEISGPIVFVLEINVSACYIGCFHAP